MRWLQSAILTTASLIPMAATADDPRAEDLRHRIAEMQNDLDRFQGPGADDRDFDTAEPPRPGDGRRAAGGDPRMPNPPGGRPGMDGPGERPMPGGPPPMAGGRQGGPGPDGAGRFDGPRPGGPMQGPGGGDVEEQKFQLRMKAREIEHQIQNLQFELETVRLQAEHLGRRQQGGPGPGGEPRRPDGMQGPGERPVRPRVQEFEQRANELRAKAEELRRGLEEAEKSGQRDRAQEMRQGLERLKNAMEKMQQEREGNRPPDANPDRPRAAGGDERMANLKRKVEELRGALRDAEEKGDERRAKDLRMDLEKCMHELTGEAKGNVDEHRAAAVAKIEKRMAEVKQAIKEAKDSGSEKKEAELRKEMEDLRAMLQKVKGEGDGEEKPVKKPRMI